MALQPGQLVLYTLGRIHDEHYAGVWITREVVAEVVRVTAKRVTIKTFFDGYLNPPDRTIAVSPSKVRPL